MLCCTVDQFGFRIRHELNVSLYMAVVLVTHFRAPSPCFQRHGRPPNTGASCGQLDWLADACVHLLQVVLHVESWDITAFQALLQVFTPGGGRQHDGPEKVR